MLGIVAVMVVMTGLLGCGAQANQSTSGTVTATPTPEPLKQKYIDLVNGFWDDHVSATSGALQVCIGTGVGTQGVNPALCGQHGKAMLKVQEKFLSDLGSVTPPAEFAAEDQTFRAKLPRANADLNAMIAAGDGGSVAAVQDAANVYIVDMQPVLEALDQINPAIQHS